MTTTDKCGTTAGAQAHYTRGEKPCEPCRQALAKYQRERYHNDPESRATKQAYHRARTKALTRLSKRFKVAFLELLGEELTKEGLDTTRTQNRAWKAALDDTEEA